MTFAVLAAQASAQISAFLAGILASPLQIFAHLAAAIGIGMVIAGAFMRTMMPLRWLAVGSNLGLMLFGALHPSTITFLIAVTLLPINIYRAVEVTRLTRRVQRAAAAADLAFKDVLQALKAQGTTLKALALNDYKIDIPLDDAFKFDVILTRKVDGKVLTVREKGPIFMMYPFERFPQLKTDIYYSRCVWQLKSLRVE